MYNILLSLQFSLPLFVAFETWWCRYWFWSRLWSQGKNKALFISESLNMFCWVRWQFERKWGRKNETIVEFLDMSALSVLFEKYSRDDSKEAPFHISFFVIPWSQLKIIDYSHTLVQNTFNGIQSDPILSTL